MLALKECTCGETTFKILVDTKIRAACTKCGTLFTQLDELPEAPVNFNFKLSPACSS